MVKIKVKVDQQNGEGGRFGGSQHLSEVERLSSWGVVWWRSGRLRGGLVNF